MIEQPKYLQYLESAKQSELADRLRAQGFDVVMEKDFGDVRFDLVAQKGQRRIAYEFKAGTSPRTDRQTLAKLQEVARREGLEFRIVVVNPPPRVRVEVDALSDRLLHYMIDEAFPDSLDTLSTHTRIQAVTDLEVSEIHIGESGIRVSGTGTVEVELNYGSDSDEIPSSGNAFPFDFRAALNARGEIEYVEELTVDTSSFYE